MNRLRAFFSLAALLPSSPLCRPDLDSLFQAASCRVQPVGCPRLDPGPFHPLAKATSARGASTRIDSAYLIQPAQWDVPFYPLGLMDAVTDFKVMGDSVLAIGRIGSRADSTRMWGVALWDGRRWTSPVSRPSGFYGRFTSFLADGNEITLTGMSSKADADKGVGLLATWDGKSWGSRKLNYESPEFTGIFYTRSLVRWNGQLVFGSFMEGIWSWGDTAAVPLPGTTDGDGMQINGMDVKGANLWAWGDIRGKGVGSFDGVNWSYPTLATKGGLSLAWLGETGFFLDSRSGDYQVLEDSSVIALLKVEGAAWSEIPLEPTMRNPRFLASDGANMYMVGTGRKKPFSGGQSEGLWIARWNGQGFQMVEKPDFLGQLTKVKVDRGRLYFSGEFSRIGGIRADNLAMWDGVKWHAFTQGIKPGLAGYATAAVSWDAKLVFGGKTIAFAGSRPVSAVASWDGTDWNTLGNGLRMDPMHRIDILPAQVKVNRLSAGNGGVYACGLFDSAGNGAAANIAHWDGMAWSPLGEGRPFEVQDMLVLDGNVYTQSYIDSDGGSSDGPMEYSKWDGRQWSSLGVLPTPYLHPNSLTAFRGSFLTSTGGEIASWTGAAWDTLDVGLSGRAGRILSHRNDLFISGNRYPAGLYKYEGASLDSVPGVQSVNSMLSDGENLFVHGRMVIPGYPEIGLARWDGTAWLPLIEYPVSIERMAAHGDYLYLFLQGPVSLDNPNFDYYLRWNRITGTWSRRQAGKPGDGKQVWKVIPCARGCDPTGQTGVMRAYDLTGRKSGGATGVRRTAAGIRIEKTGPIRH